MAEVYDIVIIGGGPAGLSTAIYTSRARYNSLLIEKTGYGGQMMLTDHIDNYPAFPDGISGFELQERMVKQAKNFGINTKYLEVNKIEKVDNKFKIHISSEIIETLSIIIASGAKHRLLNVPGEKEFSSKGVSYCATCDGPFFKNKTIYVIGGGDTAITDAVYLSKFGKEVKIVHRRDRFRAVQAYVEQAEKIENIAFIFNTEVEEIKGDKFVKSIVLKNNISNEIKEVETDGVFIFVGLIPNTEFIPAALLDESKYIYTNFKMETKTPGIYAAGDVRSGAFRQIICAVSDGATASEYSGKYVDEIKGNSYI